MFLRAREEKGIERRCLSNVDSMMLGASGRVRSGNAGSVSRDEAHSTHARPETGTGIGRAARFHAQLNAEGSLDVQRKVTFSRRIHHLMKGSLEIQRGSRCLTIYNSRSA